MKNKALRKQTKRVIEIKERKIKKNKIRNRFQSGNWWIEWLKEIGNANWQRYSKYESIKLWKYEIKEANKM